jgi:tetratricopeptide (TPR) repeat protein
MRKILYLLWIAVFYSLSPFVSAQTGPVYKSPDSAQMMARARKKTDSLAQAIRNTMDPKILAGLYVNHGLGEGIMNRPDSAIHDYSVALTLNPQLRDVYVFRCVQYIKVKNYEAGLADAEKALTFFANIPVRAADLYGKIGFLQLRMKDYEKSLKSDSAALELNPNLGFVYINSGWAYLNMHQYDKAIENFTSGLTLSQGMDKKSLSENVTGRADAKRMLKKYKEAINDYSIAIGLDPANRHAHWNRASCYNTDGDYQLADAEYTKTISFYTGDNANLAKLYDDRALMEIGEQKFQAALRDDSLSLVCNSQYAYAYWNTANAHEQNGDFQLSIDWYNKTIKYYQDNKIALSSINDAIAGEAYFLAQYDKAIAASTSAIELNKLAWGPYLNRGRAYLKNMKNDLAMADFNKVLTLDTTRKSYEYAFALFYTGSPGKAIQVMQDNIVSTNNPAMLISHYYNMACLYSLMNKPDEANTYLKKCIDGGYAKKYVQTDPDLENIRSTQEYKDLINAK